MSVMEQPVRGARLYVQSAIRDIVTTFRKMFTKSDQAQL